MREIKFRAFDRELNKWLYFTLEELINGRRRVRLKNWCEYTGLKDKNDKEIYEGDILKYQDTTSDGYLLDKDSSVPTVGIVCWVEHSCSFKPREIRENHKGGHYHSYWDQLINTEIIGNIYENPELLKSQGATNVS